MATEIPFSVFEQWRAFFNDTPFGPWRDNYNTAVAASFHANQKAGKAVVKPQDFMYESKSQSLRRKKQEREKSNLEFIARLKARAE